jgi:Cof subfamily protein (haloacid dehalogenase superfamily)
MTAPVRLVATDIDGTLLRSDGTVSDRTRAALQAAHDTGLGIAFVTGRPPRWLDVLVEQTGYRGVAVGANGAVLYDTGSEEILAAHLLDRELMLQLGAELRAAYPEVQFAIEYGRGFGAEPEYVHEWDINPPYDRRGVPIAPPRIASFVDLTTEAGVKLLAKERNVDADEFMLAATKLLGDRATVTHSSSFGLLEISAPGVTKASGLAELAESLDIEPAEVVAIGDMPNDLPMLQWAGRSYAVANAHPEVRAVADEVTISNDEDAVALLIESLLP